MRQFPVGHGEPSIGIPQKMEPKVPEQGVRIDQPAVTVVEISDPAIAGQGIELIDQDAVQLTSVPFRARRVVVHLEGGAVLYHSTNHRIRTRTKAQRGLLAYVTFDPRAKGTVNGLPIRPELMLAVEPETEVGKVISLLLEDRIGALPVGEPGTREVLGIISYVDVLRALQDLVEED